MTKKQKQFLIGTLALGTGTAGFVLGRKLPLNMAYRGMRSARTTVNTIGNTVPRIRAAPARVASALKSGYKSSPIVQKADRVLWKYTGARIIPKPSLEEMKAAEDAVKRGVYAIKKGRFKPKGPFKTDRPKGKPVAHHLWGWPT
jgi:hypothetical protein